MQIQENISLRPYNTFGIDVTARFFTSFNSLESLQELVTSPLFNSQPHMVLGGGSNVLFTSNYNGLVLRNELTGIERVNEDADHYYIRAAAGENWHQFVLHCIENNYAGVENLSLIPGNVGASPMQNIGAYGVEIKDVFHELEAYSIANNTAVIFNKEDCEFGYRESVFKKKYKGKFIITSVTFRLSKQANFNTSYGAIQQELDAMGVQQLNIAAISQAVINIRRSKLPDPAVTGNAGSFFKNPTIPNEQFEQLKQQHPAIVGYSAGTSQTKVAAGWLIEQAGWKGYRTGDAGCHPKQALVLVNYGHATGNQVYALSEEIVQSVQDRFGIILEREVNII
ncbi:UDP-N-acetylmuramate dehydrogenase [Aridibaculum aurantiacum]|uniref:UDP-N-acetylmuramate dehydrogenase n=1 Tax=Aridibaculum aurantiacum TaxID=2810307 RepID=UPI001A96C895|nr:UDP-N-acetylmuramate dehydrogenase [Aridibaculum aurantiacum]